MTIKSNSCCSSNVLQKAFITALVLIYCHLFHDYLSCTAYNSAWSTWVLTPGLTRPGAATVTWLKFAKLGAPRGEGFSPRVSAVASALTPARDWVRSSSPVTFLGPSAVIGGRMSPNSATVICSKQSHGLSLNSRRSGVSPWHLYCAESGDVTFHLTGLYLLQVTFTSKPRLLDASLPQTKPKKQGDNAEHRSAR